jgi:DNA-directed RNA polymerase subunit RPC12/RpoP
MLPNRHIFLPFVFAISEMADKRLKEIKFMGIVKKTNAEEEINTSEEYCCLYCGRKLIVEYAKGRARIECPRCKTVTVSRLVSALHNVIDVYLPAE